MQAGISIKKHNVGLIRLNTCETNDEEILSLEKREIEGIINNIIKHTIYIQQQEDNNKEPKIPAASKNIGSLTCVSLKIQAKQFSLEKLNKA